MLITNANLITWGQPIQILGGQALLVSDGKIAEIGPSADLEKKHPDAERLDAGGQYVLPGLINSHGHYYSAFAVGAYSPGDAPFSLPTILQKFWFPFDLALDEDGIRYSAWNGVLDAIRHGNTTLFDHHSSQGCIDGALDIIAEVVEEAGLRSVLCFETTDRNGPAAAKAGIAENARFIKRCSQEKVAGKEQSPSGKTKIVSMTATTTIAAAPAVVSEERPDSQDKTAFIASKNSKIFHRPTCRFARVISQKNIIKFETRDKALQSGRRPGKTCTP